MQINFVELRYEITLSQRQTDKNVNRYQLLKLYCNLIFLLSSLHISMLELEKKTKRFKNYNYLVLTRRITSTMKKINKKYEYQFIFLEQLMALLNRMKIFFQVGLILFQKFLILRYLLL